MIAIFALCIPPLILVCFRNRVLGNHVSRERNVLFYLFSTLSLNWLMMLILYIGFHNNEDLFEKLNSHLGFTCKYIALSCLIAVAEPFVERFIMEHFHFSFPRPYAVPTFHHWRICAIIYSVVLFLLNFIRIFDNNFWGDEAFTANLVQYSVTEIISKTAADVHPPLYYLFVKLAYTIFGKQGWSFHFVSLIPCAIIIIFALTAIWKKFGKGTAMILITFQCLSTNAIVYNVEVRMYSWGGLFILLSFYYFCCILESNRTRSYILFVLFSLAAAYTHYYCLVSVAFLYLALLFLAFLKRNVMLKKVVLACAVTIVGYLPWFFIMLNSMLSRSDNYWITSIPTFWDSMKYLFSSQFPTWLWYAVGGGLVLAVAYETGVLVVQWDKDNGLSIALNFKAVRFSNNIFILVAGILSVIGTIGFGIGISNLVRPFYTFRYIYPVSVVAWLLLGVIISRLKGRKLYAIVLILYLLSIFLPAFQNKYVSEKKANDMLTSTLKATAEIETGNVILTNHSHIDWTIAGYYYPGVKTQLVTLSDMPELDNATVYWLIASESQEMDKTFEQLTKQGFTYERIVDGGNLGTYTVYIYKLVYTPERTNE